MPFQLSLVQLYSVQYSLIIIVSFLCLLNLIKTLGLLTTICCGQNRSNLLSLGMMFQPRHSR